MPRDLLLGNGSLVVAFDSRYRLADVYFPHAGLENHAGTRFRFGVWCDGALSWVEDEPWERTIGYLQRMRDSRQTIAMWPTQNDELRRR